MRTRTRITYLALMPLFVAAYIVLMASASAKEKRDEHRGPNDYANPHGHHWGVGHGKGGPPSKTP